MWFIISMLCCANFLRTTSPKVFYIAIGGGKVLIYSQLEASCGKWLNFSTLHELKIILTLLCGVDDG